MKDVTEKPRKKGFLIPTKSTSALCEQATKSHKKSIGKTDALTDCTNKPMVQDQEKMKPKKKKQLHKKTETLCCSEISTETAPKKKAEIFAKQKDVLSSKLTNESYDDIFKSVLEDFAELEASDDDSNYKPILLPESAKTSVESKDDDKKKKNSNKKHQTASYARAKAPYAQAIDPSKNKEKADKVIPVEREFANKNKEQSTKMIKKPKKIKIKGDLDDISSVVAENGDSDEKAHIYEKPKKTKKKENVNQVSLVATKKKARKTPSFPKLKEKRVKKVKVNQIPSLPSDDSSEEEEGTWIQCTNTECNKWRYVEDIQDPLSVPDKWECSMNSDIHHKSCDDLEEMYDEDEHILTRFTIGSLVWVKMDGFPWWPAIVESDPDYDTYFELPNLESMNPTMYHVTFLGKQVSRAWMRTSRILPYTNKPTSNCEVPKKLNSLKSEMERALNDAEEALCMTLKNRLLRFGFSQRFSTKSKSRFTDPYPTKEDSDEDYQELIKAAKKASMEKNNPRSNPLEKLKQKSKPETNLNLHEDDKKDNAEKESDIGVDLPVKDKDDTDEEEKSDIDRDLHEDDKNNENDEEEKSEIKMASAQKDRPKEGSNGENFEMSKDSFEKTKEDKEPGKKSKSEMNNDSHSDMDADSDSNETSEESHKQMKNNKEPQSKKARKLKEEAKSERKMVREAKSDEDINEQDEESPKEKEFDINPKRNISIKSKHKSKVEMNMDLNVDDKEGSDEKDRESSEEAEKMKMYKSPRKATGKLKLKKSKAEINKDQNKEDNKDSNEEDDEQFKRVFPKDEELRSEDSEKLKLKQKSRTKNKLESNDSSKKVEEQTKTSPKKMKIDKKPQTNISARSVKKSNQVMDMDSNDDDDDEKDSDEEENGESVERMKMEKKLQCKVTRKLTLKQKSKIEHNTDDEDNDDKIPESSIKKVKLDKRPEINLSGKSIEKSNSKTDLDLQEEDENDSDNEDEDEYSDQSQKKKKLFKRKGSNVSKTSKQTSKSDSLDREDSSQEEDDETSKKMHKEIKKGQMSLQKSNVFGKLTLKQRSKVKDKEMENGDGIDSHEKDHHESSLLSLKNQKGDKRSRNDTWVSSEENDELPKRCRKRRKMDKTAQDNIKSKLADVADKETFEDEPSNISTKKIKIKTQSKLTGKFSLKQKSKSHVTNSDQHVPDIVQPVSALEEERSVDTDLDEDCDKIMSQDKLKDTKLGKISSSKQKDQSKVINSKVNNCNEDDDDDDDVEELSLEIDPVPDIDDIIVKKDANLGTCNQIEDDEDEQFDFDLLDNVGNNKSEDKWRFGRFRGHCSENGSEYSDPLDIIED